jgi:hypothetical protein
MHPIYPDNGDAHRFLINRLAPLFRLRYPELTLIIYVRQDFSSKRKLRVIMAGLVDDPTRGTFASATCCT